MIALTQEKREELIKECEFDIERLTTLTAEFPEEKSLQSVLLRQKIALSSLTAECKYFQWGWARDENSVWTTTPMEKLSDAVSAFGKDGENVIYRMLFTAPPVPEIKFPEKLNQYESLPLAGEDAWNECIDEVKRLNGLGE